MQATILKRSKFYTVNTFVLLAAILLIGCRDKVAPGTKVEIQRPQVSGVSVSELKLSPVSDYYETAATIKAKNIGVISSKIMGSVTSVSVQEGQRVSRGQKLLTIDDSDVSQKVHAAKGAVESARQQKQLADVTFSRYEKLFNQKALSRQEFDQIETQKKIAGSELDRAQAMLREAQAYQAYANVRAPFNGIVTGKKIDPGSMAMPGMQLLTVEDTSAFVAEAAMDEKFSAMLKPGMTVDVIIDSLNQTIKGKVSEVVPSIDPMSRTFVVKVAITGNGLRSGLYARVRVPAGSRDALVIPASSIVEKGQLTGVYAVDASGIISYRLVRTGRKFGEDIEVLSGVNQGDRIIVLGMDKAIDGGVVSGQTANPSSEKSPK